MNGHWIPFLTGLTIPIPISEGLDPLALLTDDAQVAAWNNEGLPSTVNPVAVGQSSMASVHS
jgi:dynein heavy chain